MNRPHDPWPVSIAALKLATRVIDEIQAGVRSAGFADVTPVHGFVFARVADGEATAGDVAEHLGVSKQAASQLVERLVRAGYLRRTEHPRDQRARLLELTPQGQACTRAARHAAEHAVQRWREELSPQDAKRFESALLALTASVVPLRPPY
jgi:DNA-binding MarR family transcriptional regulator